MRKKKQDEEYLVTYTRHLERRLRNLETEKQLLDAEKLRLEQELHSLRNEVKGSINDRVRKSPIVHLRKLVPANLRNIFGEILEILIQIVLNTRHLGNQGLQDVKSKISNLLEEIKEIEKKTLEPREGLLKWYELISIKDQTTTSFDKTEREEEKKTDYAFNIIVLGEPRKTTFIQRFITGKIKEDIQMTIGVDYSFKKVEVQGKTVKLRIWDFSAEERFRFLLSKYIKDTNGAIIMYDAIDAKTTKTIVEVIELIKMSVGDIPIFLAIPELPSKTEEFDPLTEMYTFIELTSETGPNGEKAFELLSKKMLENEHIE